MKNNKCKNASIIIMKRELKSYFSSPIAYFVTGLFLLVAGLFFFTPFFLQNRAELRALFAYFPIFLGIFIPAVTMRNFAEERRIGSMETLMTLPVTEFQVTLGKYLASFISSLVMIVPTLLYLIPVEVFGSPDYGPIIGGYLGAIFLCACFSAIGLFSSSITKNQIIAYFVGGFICLALALVHIFFVFLPAPAIKFFTFISANAHFESISRGILDSRDFIYFISLAVLFFLMTVRHEENQKK
ncbi:MAG: ABC transporter permease [Spirochaetales bacterium]|nr:ABC transporter permease [Spirochaetales bacterium]